LPFTASKTRTRLKSRGANRAVPCSPERPYELVIILAIPFGEHRELAKALPSSKGKTVIDMMNSFPLPPEELDCLLKRAGVNE